MNEGFRLVFFKQNCLCLGKWYAPGELIFEDEFDQLLSSNWEHEITLAGGGNWEFQAYTHNRTNRSVSDCIKKNERICC